MGGMDLRKLPLPPPPPYPLQPSPARPRGRWGLGGQDVRAKAGGRWEGELKAQRPFTTTGRGLTAPAGAVLAAATTPQLLGIGGGVQPGWACFSAFAANKGLNAHGNWGWKEKRKQLSPGKRFGSDMTLTGAAGAGGDMALEVLLARQLS